MYQFVNSLLISPDRPGAAFLFRRRYRLKKAGKKLPAFCYAVGCGCCGCPPPFMLLMICGIFSAI